MVLLEQHALGSSLAFLPAAILLQAANDRSKGQVEKGGSVMPLEEEVKLVFTSRLFENTVAVSCLSL